MTKQLITEEQLLTQGFEFFESEFLGGCTLEGEELEDHLCDDWKDFEWFSPNTHTWTLDRTCSECGQIERLIYVREK